MNTKKVHITDYCPKCGAVLDSRHDPKCDGRRRDRRDLRGVAVSKLTPIKPSPLMSVTIHQTVTLTMRLDQWPGVMAALDTEAENFQNQFRELADSVHIQTHREVSVK